MRPFELYPELRNYSTERRKTLLEHARYRASRKKGASAKLVGWMVLIVGVGFVGKVFMDLLFIESLGQVTAGFVSGMLLFPLAGYLCCKAYASALKPEISLLIDGEDVEQPGDAGTRR